MAASFPLKQGPALVREAARETLSAVRSRLPLQEIKSSYVAVSEAVAGAQHSRNTHKGDHRQPSDSRSALQSVMERGADKLSDGWQVTRCNNMDRTRVIAGRRSNNTNRIPNNTSTSRSFRNDGADPTRGEPSTTSLSTALSSASSSRAALSQVGSVQFGVSIPSGSSGGALNNCRHAAMNLSTLRTTKENLSPHKEVQGERFYTSTPFTSLFSYTSSNRFSPRQGVTTIQARAFGTDGKKIPVHFLSRKNIVILCTF